MDLYFYCAVVFYFSLFSFLFFSFFFLYIFPTKMSCPFPRSCWMAALPSSFFCCGCWVSSSYGFLTHFLSLFLLWVTFYLFIYFSRNIHQYFATEKKNRHKIWTPNENNNQRPQCWRRYEPKWKGGILTHFYQHRPRPRHLRSIREALPFKPFLLRS